MEGSKPKRIGFVLVDGFSLMSLASATEPLRAANHLAGQKIYDVRFISAEGTRATSSSGLFSEGTILSDAGYDFDMVLVAAGGNPSGYDNEPLKKYLKMLAGHRVALGGISGGPFILAQAGLLKDRRFTVHWDHYEAIKELSNELVIEKSLYVIDDDRYTCAGGVAPMDMMSAIIAADHGRALAKSVNDWYIYTSVREASAPQRAGLVEKYQVHHPAVLCAIELMQNHLSDPLTSKQIALLSSIGERQMSRLFQKYLGKKPMQFYSELRLEHARVLTQQSSLSIIEVALASGYDSPTYFSKKFKELYGLSPSEIRKSGQNEYS